jgi:hypothetical protein
MVRPDIDIKITINTNGPQGNIFYVLGVAANVLETHGFMKEKQEMIDRVTASFDYEKAKQIIAEYVDMTYISK